MAAPKRRIALGDLMVLIAVAAPSLILIRIAASLGLFDLGRMIENGKTAPFGRQLVELLSLGGGCILAGLMPAVLLLGLYRARPDWRDALQGSGLLSCFVAVASGVLPVFWFVAAMVEESRSGVPSYSVHFNNLFARWTNGGGAMVLGGWIVLFLSRRLRPKPTWADQMGFLLGGCLLAIYLYAEIYFTVRMISYW